MEELIPTIYEEGEERIDTVQEGTIIAGVQTINGKAGDLDLKTINGQDILTAGDLSLATTEQLATKQDQLTETQLEAVNSGIDADKVQQIADNTTAIAGKQDQLTQTQLNAVNSGIDETKVAQIATNTGNITSNTNRITTIEGKIPSAATSTNQLTDKNYVDNSIATNTADYISDNGQPFQSLADLEAYSGQLTNNDYAFVVSTDSAGNLLYTRYKYNSTTEQWAEEYTIANPTFTSTQWAAIDSGVTANDVTQIGTNKSDIANLQSGKQDALSQTQLDAVNSGIDATKVQQIATNASDITNLQNDKQDKLIAGTNIQIASDGKTISATDTTYTAGTGLTLAGTQFSVTEPVPSGFFTDTQGTQIGEGTAITLNHTPNAPIDNVELKGDTSQTTLSGKNLIPYGEITLPTAGPGGVSYIDVVDFGEDVTFSSLALSLFLENAIYTNDSGALIDLLKDDGTHQYMTPGSFTGMQPDTSLNGQFSRAYTSSRTFRYVRVFVVSAGYVKWTQGKIKLQLELGSTATAYEPWCGSTPSSITPSPNPDYPQQIDTVTGEQTVSVVGKNLFNKSATPFRTGTDFYNIPVGSTITAGTSANVSVAQTSNGFTVTNTANWNGAIFLTEVKPQTSYNLKYAQTGSGSLARSTYYTLDSNYTVLTKAPISSDNFTVNTHIATTEDTKYIAVSVGGSSATTVTITEPQIELGQTATTYQPYQSQTYKVNLGKNLFQPNGSSGSSNGITYTFNADGTVTVSGEATAQTSFKIGDISLKGGASYVLSGCPAGGGSTTYQLYTNVLDPQFKDYGSGDTHELTADSSGGVYFVVRSGVNISTPITVKPMFELGTTPSGYSQYFTPIELCKIGTYQDYIWKDGSDWKVHKAIGEVTLDGSKGTFGSDAFDSNRRCYLVKNSIAGLPTAYYDGTTTPPPLSDLMIGSYQGVIASPANATGCLFFPHTSVEFYFTVPDTLAVDGAAFKTWLTTHPMTIYYVLATATDTTITDANLIAQLEALAGSTTYAPQTNYTTSTPSPNLPTILTIDVFKNNYAGLLARLNKAGA